MVEPFVSTSPQKVQSREPKHGYILPESNEAAYLHTLLLS